jgi:putative flippase GtrA
MDIINYFFKFEFIRFGFIGFLNTVIDYGLMNILMWIFKTNNGNGFLLIKIFSIAMSIIFSYYANLQWTFKSKNNTNHQLLQFICLSVITICVNVWITTYLVNSVDLNINGYLWANIASFAGAIVAITTRYFGSRIIFNK